MGLFASARQMFDGRPGSPMEDWLRQQGIMGPAVANGAVDGGSLFNMHKERPPHYTPGYGDGVGVEASVGGGSSSPRGLFANGRKPSSIAPSLPDASPQVPVDNPPIPVGSTAGIEQSRFGGGMTGMSRGGSVSGIDLQAALADNAMKAPPKKRGGGFNLRDALLAFAGGPEIAYRIRKDRQERDAKAEQSERMAMIQSQAYNHLVYDKGMHPAQAELIVQANPEKLAEEWATSQRTREVSEGESVVGPNGRYTAPKTFEVGTNVYRYDPQAGAAERIIQGQTDAERYAQTFGFQPGSPEFIGAVKDFTLKNDGPTAFGQNRTLQNDRLQQQDINNRRSVGASIGNNIRSTGTSRENSIRSTGTSRDNNIRSTSTSRQNSQDSNATRQGAYSYKNGGGRGRGGASAAPTARGPNGETITWNGKSWVDGTGKVYR